MFIPLLSEPFETKLSKIVSLSLFLFNHLEVEKVDEDEEEPEVRASEESEGIGSVEECDKDTFWSLSVLLPVIFVKYCNVIDT